MAETVRIKRGASFVTFRESPFGKLYMCGRQEWTSEHERALARIFSAKTVRKLPNNAPSSWPFRFDRILALNHVTSFTGKLGAHQQSAVGDWKSEHHAPDGRTRT